MAARLLVPDVSGDTEQLDVEYADPQTKTRGEKSWSELGFKLLKTVDVAGLTTEDGNKVIPLAKGETAPGRAFRVVAAKTVTGIRYPSKPSGFDYANQAPYSSGKIAETFTVGDKGARIALDKHLYDPDGRPTKIQLIDGADPFSKDPLPAWAEIQGNDLVIDASEERAETTLAVELTDEKDERAILDVIVTVITPDAPDAPGDVVYVAI
ncbi:MAG TPA: hypothetical protein VF594_11000 [Rubricoccaceae bacterium]|jgi:hypothetical protein